MGRLRKKAAGKARESRGMRRNVAYAAMTKDEAQRSIRAFYEGVKIACQERFMLRKARIGDVKTIHRLINLSSGQGEMRPRSLMDIYGSLRDFFIYQDEKKEEILG